MTWFVFYFLKVKTVSRHRSLLFRTQSSAGVIPVPAPTVTMWCEGYSVARAFSLPLFMEKFLFLGFGLVKSRHGPLSPESPSEISQLFKAGPWFVLSVL